MSRIRPSSVIAAIALLLAACGGDQATTSPATSPSPTPDTTASAPATESPTVGPTDDATESPSPAVSPSMVEGPTGFPVHANAEADSLFLDRDTCSNERDNYEVSFPDAWFTNTEIGRNPACIWFSPTDYEVPDPAAVPDEIAITIEWHEGDVGRHDADIAWREDLLVGAQAASRVEWDDDTYWYVIQLGPSSEAGPNLVVTTSAAMGGDYDLNKAVLDRMMATIEFFGSTD